MGEPPHLGFKNQPRVHGSSSPALAPGLELKLELSPYLSQASMALLEGEEEHGWGQYGGDYRVAGGMHSHRRAGERAFCRGADGREKAAGKAGMGGQGAGEQGFGRGLAHHSLLLLPTLQQNLR